LADFEKDVTLRWYLRCESGKAPQGEALSGGAVIVGPMAYGEAKALAEKTQAQALLPVLG
jgi:hypothetical protein